MSQTTPPKANPVRRNARVGPTILPAEGRKGAPPSWPLAGRHTAAEKITWAELWATPQAVAWETFGAGCVRVVARYCRLLHSAEAMNKDALAEARQIEDKLGLTPKAMRMLLWVISADELAEKRDDKTISNEVSRPRIRAVG